MKSNTRKKICVRVLHRTLMSELDVMMNEKIYEAQETLMTLIRMTRAEKKLPSMSRFIAKWSLASKF
jgi:hypothetical protein